MKSILLILLLGAGMAHAQQSVLVVSGMTEEAKIASGDNVITVLSGANPMILAAALAKIDPKTIRAVVSFGVAGGLDSSLKAGNAMVATDLVDQNGVHFPVDPTLSATIQADLKQHHVKSHAGLMAGSDVELTDEAAKAAFALKTGALSVDTESEVAASWAAANHLPFAVLRTISDPESLSLPRLVTDALNPDGSLNLGAIFSDFWKDPSQLGGVIQTGIDAVDAFAVLQRCRNAVDLGHL